MHITLRQLAVFDAIARTGSVSLAATEISLSQSAASLSLKELERSLGAPLFERRGKRLVLNDNGRRLHPRANSLLHQAREFYLPSQAARLRGTLRISASTTIGHYVLPAICGAFLREHPQVQFQLDIGATIEVVGKVRNVAAQLGLIEGPCNDRALSATRWLQDQLVFFVAPTHRLAARAAVSIHDLQDEVWFVEPTNFTTRTVVLSAIAAHLPSVNIGFVSSSVEAIKRAVRSSNGIGCLSQFAVADEIGRGELSALRVAEIRISRAFSIVRRREEYQGELLRRFLEFLQAHPGAPPGSARP